MKKITLLLLLIGSTSFAQFTPHVIAKSNDWINPAAIDFDQDGITDLVSASTDGQIAWWQKDSAMNFTKIEIANTQKSWSSFDIEDMDNDGDIDILLSSYDSIEIYYNDGNMNFSESYFGNFFLTSNVLAGDFDDDGYMDFVTTNRASNGPITFWRNIQNSYFEANSMGVMPIFLGDALANDFDNDGDIDIVASIDSGFWNGLNVIFYENNGAGTFTQNFINYDFKNGNTQIIDYDFDNDKDIIVQKANQVILLKNNGTLNFTPITLLNLPSSAQLDDIYVSDIENDGDFDIITIQNPSNAPDFSGVYLNNGNNVFTLNTIELLEKGESVTAVEFNGDQIPEWVVTSNAADDPRIYKRQGNGTYLISALDNSFINPTSFDITDMNGDGLMDVITTSKDQKQLILWKNLGNFDFEKIIIDSDASLIEFAEAVDMDGDGLKDILVTESAFNKGKINLYHNNGNLSFLKRLYINTTSAQRAYTADIDYDLDLDIILTRGGQARAYRNNGDDTYSLEVIGSFSGDEVCSGFRDVNNDGIMDITTTGSIYLRNDGNGNFTTQPLPVAGTFFDLDSDGDLDMLDGEVLNGDNVSWYENGGSGTFTEHIISTSDRSEYFIAQDFDGDCDMDIVSIPASDYNSQGLVYWTNNGNQIFTKSIIESEYKYASGLFLADLDSDDDSDFISTSLKFPFTIWENTVNIPAPANTYYADFDNDNIGDSNYSILACIQPSHFVITNGDNCPLTFNPQQEDLDGDGLGNDCDDDIDGDGYTNDEEIACGSDPYDPLDYCGLGISENSLENAFVIYPNPTSKTFTIKASPNVEIQELTINNVAGQIIKKPETSKSVDVSDLSNGLYFIEIKSDKGTVIKKIIKN